MAGTTSTTPRKRAAKKAAPAPGNGSEGQEQADEQAAAEAPAVEPAVDPHDETATIWQRLAAPFPEDEIELLPKQLSKQNNQRAACNADNPDRNGLYCGGYHAPSVHLHYVGHAGITTRLNEVVGPEGWSWEPVSRAVDPTLLAQAVASGDTDMVRLLMETAPPKIVDNCMWIRLTVNGVTKLGFGDAQGKTGANAVKEIIGDALRNASMRFGIGTYLWSKSAKAQAQVEQHAEPAAAGPAVDLPSGEVVKARVERALEGREQDPTRTRAAVIEVANGFGREVLDRVKVETSKGEVVASEWVDQWLSHLASKVAQEAAEGTQRDVKDDAPAEAEGTPVPTVEPEAAPAAEAAPNSQPAVDPAVTAWLGEVAVQAEVLGVQARKYLHPLMDGRGNDPRAVPVNVLKPWVFAQRPKVIDALKEQGRAAAADAFAKHAQESANEPVRADVLTGDDEGARADTAEGARAQG